MSHSLIKARTEMQETYQLIIWLILLILMPTSYIAHSISNQAKVNGDFVYVADAPRDYYCHVYCNRPCGDCFDPHNCGCVYSYDYFCLDYCAFLCGC